MENAAFPAKPPPPLVADNIRRLIHLYGIDIDLLSYSGLQYSICGGFCHGFELRQYEP